MAYFTDVAALIPTLCGTDAVVDDAATAQAAVMLMTDADVVAVLRETAALKKQVEQIHLAAAGVISMRSARERGHSGLSASQGFRSASSLIQDVTGSSKAEANRSARVGEALVDAGDAGVVGVGPGGLFDHGDAPGAADAHEPPRPWFEPLKDALRAGRLSSAQFDAIRRGLGELPAFDARAADAGAEVLVDPDAFARAHEAAREAWSQAAEQLVGEASERTVEELWQAARTVRDLLDPEGAEARYLARFENRSFRTYRGQDGQKRASMVFEDDGDLFVETMMAAALRPRRGGPRFVDPVEKAQAEALTDDPRTTDQLAYDLMMDVIRAGALADATAVFGTRQAGVRLVQVIDPDGAPMPVAHSEDGLISIPGALAAQHICDSGTVPVTVDACGNPLDVGREHRLFTPKQRIALAIRDGGCRWRGCDRPSSYCEAHHIDEWDRDQGRTDIDRGILLCRYHHMTLHHGGWWITRDGKEDFVLHHPSGETFPMRPRAALNYAWEGIDPPPKRFRPVA